MKNLFAILGLFSLVFAAPAALPQPDLIAQIHFAGVQKISTGAHSALFTEEFCSPEAQALRAQTATKLSGWLGGWLGKNLKQSQAESAAQWRPLLDDLQNSEWYLEARVAADGRPEVAIAIKLDTARIRVWEANLKPFFPAASFKSVSGWLIFDSNPGLAKLGDQLEQKFSAPSAAWLELDINWPRLAQWHPLLKELALPETQFTVTGADDAFHVNGKCFFPENLALNLEPWRVPTNTIRAPLDSFTAVRGFAAWLQAQAWARPYQIKPAPNQLITWSLPSIPFQTYAALPVPNAASALAQVFAEVAPAFKAANASNAFLSPIEPIMTNKQIVFTRMPFIGPQLRPVTEPAGQFLFLETFPNTPRGKPLPPELFQHLADKSLVYYHWENTAERIPQLLQVSQFGLMMTLRKQLSDEAASFKWIQKAGLAPGTNDTEIVQSGAAEFTFSRKAPALFTGPEFYLLANWLEATNFPGCDLKLPARPQRAKHQQPQPFQLTTPVPGH